MAGIINEVPKDTIVNVTGVMLLQDITTVQVSGNMVAIRHGHICDESDYIRVVLWLEYARSFINGKTYTICNMQKSIWNNEAELQSTNTSAFQEVAAIKNFQSPNQDVDDEISPKNCTFIGAKLTHNTKCIFLQHCYIMHWLKPVCH